MHYCLDLAQTALCMLQLPKTSEIHNLYTTYTQVINCCHIQISTNNNFNRQSRYQLHELIRPILGTGK